MQIKSYFNFIILIIAFTLTIHAVASTNLIVDDEILDENTIEDKISEFITSNDQDFQQKIDELETVANRHSSYNKRLKALLKHILTSKLAIFVDDFEESAQ